jgi:putative membrane protein
MDAVTAMFLKRPEVVANVAAFGILACAERGWRRTAGWLVTGTFIGWLMELSSVRTGFPFGAYAYRQANFPDEAWFGGVPLFASLSFAALSYFGYSAACTMLSPLRRQGWDVQRIDSPAITGSLSTLLLASLLTTWLDVVIDPVTHLGKYWRLGDLYQYASPSGHFNIPLSNYGGWLLTIFCIVLTNQAIDRIFRRVEASPPRGFLLPYRPFWAIAAQLGTFAHMLVMTVYLMSVADVPAETQLGGILASGLFFTGLYVAFAVTMIRRGLSRSLPTQLRAREAS